MRIAIGLLAGILILGGAADICAQGNAQHGRGGQGNSATQPHDAPGVDIDITLGSEEIRVIRDWFGNPSNLEGLPRGLAKREALPPGLQRQLQRRGTLPPGLQSKAHHLPLDLEGRLPSKRAGLSRIVIGGNVILLEEATSMIMDIVSLF